MVVAAVGIGLSLQPPVDRLSGREAFEGGGVPYGGVVARPAYRVRYR